MDGSGALIQDMIRFSALGYQRGLIVGTGGNVSCRCPEGVCITASGTCLGDMDAEDILLVNLSGCVMQGAAGKRPSIETPFHIAVYQVRPDVSCVYHTHATYCTYWALQKKELPMVTSVSRMLLGSVPRVGYSEPGTLELAERVHDTLTEYPGIKAFLLAGHGAVALGSSPEDAFYTAELLEQTAKLAYMLEQ